MIKSYIWPLASRISHIVMIVSFILAYIFADFDEFLYLHAVFGAVFGLAVVFRIFWGIIGSKYSKFSDFNFRGLKEYFTSFFNQKKVYIGHNPASSIAIILMLFLGLALVISGFILYGVSENSGIFAFLYNSYGNLHFIEDFHEILFYAILYVIIAHTCGALIDKFVHKNDSIDSMINGYKNTKQDESIKLNSFQKFYNIFWIVGLIIFLIYAFMSNNALFSPKYTYINYKAQNEEFVKECASCHMLYAPFLLPTQGWQAMMADLENHFGDDASIDEKANKNISNFLFENSSQNNNTKIAYNITKASKDDKNITITKNDYWIKAHKKIPQEIFDKNSVKSKANCLACHTDIDKGVIAKNLIKYEQIKPI